jgi:hypothetical protein
MALRAERQSPPSFRALDGVVSRRWMVGSWVGHGGECGNGSNVGFEKLRREPMQLSASGCAVVERVDRDADNGEGRMVRARQRRWWRMRVSRQRPYGTDARGAGGAGAAGGAAACRELWSVLTRQGRWRRMRDS